MNAIRIASRALRGGALAAVLGTTTLVYADITWTGSVDDDWNNPGNWIPGGVPTGMVNDVIVFGPEMPVDNHAVMNADSDITNVDGLLFTNASGAYTIDGTGKFTFSGVGGESITNDSMFTQTLNVNIAGTGMGLSIFAGSGDLVLGQLGVDTLEMTGGATSVLAISASTSRNVTINSVISDTGGGLFKTGTGTLTLNGANTYTGNTTLSGGTIIAGDNMAFGVGNIIVNSGSTIEAGGGPRALNNNISSNTFGLTVSGTNNLSLLGVISGTGGLTKKGSATLLLTGTNTFVGPTNLLDGTLQVLGGGALPDAGQLQFNGLNARLELLSSETIGSITSGAGMNGIIDLGANTLTIAAAAASSFGGVINGTGGVALTGSNILVLNGASTYSGGTVVSAAGATLGMGNDLALGTGTLTLTDDAILLPVGVRTIANDITINTPAFSVDGTESITFNGTVDLSGVATAITVNNTADTNFAGVISNGSLMKAGAGTLTLSGLNTYLGDTDINSGRLVLNGSVMGATFVNANGTLSGTGSAGGGLTARAGSTVEAGTGGIGVLRVGGNYSQEAGSILRVDVNAANGTSNLLDVTGTATLQGGSTIAVAFASPEFIVAGETFKIIEADGGVFDGGAIIDTSSATLRFEIQREATFMDGDLDYRLQAVRDPDAYSDAATPGNNEAVGGGLDSLIPIANADPTGEAGDLLGQLDTLDDTQLNEALNELSPERYNAAANIGFNAATEFTSVQSQYLAGRRGAPDAFAMRDTRQPQAGALAYTGNSPYVMGQAIEAADDNPFDWPDLEPETSLRIGGFARGFGVFSDVDSDRERTGYETDTYGGTVGIDYRLTRALIGGVALGYVNSKADYDRSLGELDSDTFRVGPYFTWLRDDFWLDASVTYGTTNYDGTRKIPTLGLKAKSDYDGYDITTYVGIGTDWAIDNAWSLRPSLSLQYSYFDFDGFREKDAGGANLTVEGRDSDSLRSRLGLAIQYESTDSLFVQGFVGWQQEYLDDDDDVESRFSVGGNPFSVDTGDRDDTAVFFGASVASPVAKNGMAYLRFEGAVGSDSNAYAVTGGVSFRF